MDKKEQYLNVRELSSAEEHLGETEPVLALGDLEPLEDSLGGRLGVLGVAGDVGDQEVISLHELGVDRPVGESKTGNPNSFEHTF